MTVRLVEDWTPPLANHVGDWKPAPPMGVTFCRPLQDRSPLFDAPVSTAQQERIRFASNTLSHVAAFPFDVHDRVEGKAANIESATNANGQS